jgi:DNA-binding NtrC family response regulator
MDRDETSDDAQVIRLHPMRVLVVSEDEPFRAVNAMLVARRGCRVFSLTGVYAAAELIARERIDVVVVDGPDRARSLIDELELTADLVTPVGIVCAGNTGEAAPSGEAVIEKWAPFEDLFAAIVRADRARARELSPGAAPSHGAAARALD